MNEDQQEQEHTSGMTMLPPEDGVRVPDSLSSYHSTHLTLTHDSVSPDSISISPSLNSIKSDRESADSAYTEMNSTSTIVGSTGEPVRSTPYIPVVSTSQFSNSTQQALNSTQQALNSTQHALNSTQQALNSTQQALNSTQQALNSTQQALNSTSRSENTSRQSVNSSHNQSSSSSQSFSSTTQPIISTQPYLSSTHQTLSSTHQTLSATHQSFSSKLQYLNSIHQSLGSTQQTLSSTPQPISSTHQTLGSTPHTLLTIPTVKPTFRTSSHDSPDSNHLTSTTESLSSSLQRVTTTQVASLGTPEPSSQNLIRSLQKPQNLEREPQEAFINHSTTTDSPPLTTKKRHHQNNVTTAASGDQHLTTSTSQGPRHRTRNLAPRRRSAKSLANSATTSPSPEVPIAQPLDLGSSEDVCRSDPCGAGVSCHPTSVYPYYKCICPDGTVVLRNETNTCEDQHLEVVPEAKAVLPTVVNKSNNVVGAAVVASVVLTVVLLLVYWRRKTLYTLLKHSQREKNSGPKSPGALAKSTSLLTYNFASNPNYYSQSPDALPLHSLAVQLIDSEQIAFLGELGEGCFGKVYKGTYGPRCPENLGETVGVEGVGGEGVGVSLTVAVKVLKESAGVEAEADFLREVEIMSTFRHDNILSLIGIVVTETVGTPWMVFEYMAYGDLAEVLRSCNKQFYSSDSPIKSLSKEDLLNMSVQIASGMEYLSSQHFVHRDLACRNCLVGESLTVKISDFGMSRDVYTCDYYKVGGSRMLPVRWMAHESIMYGKFTLESDVWSFGVVLWEIYSFGKQPYYGNSNENVVKLIFQGILLSPPDTCPPQVCDVMRRCWATDPNDRLKFPEILERLQRLQECQKGTVAPPVSPSNTAGVPAPVTYSELCLHDEGGLEVDCDQYLMPRRVEHREYITVLSDV